MYFYLCPVVVVSYIYFPISFAAIQVNNILFAAKWKNSMAPRDKLINTGLGKKQALIII